MEVSLDYRPCTCPRYEVNRKEGVSDPGRGAPEFFESDIYAATRFREHIRAGRVPRVHLGVVGSSCLHVKAVTIDGELYSEPSDGRAR